jgi:uncharacterized protein YdaU (DUF1376 family)
VPMSKPRAFLFDVDAWLGSLTVELMSGDAVKAYVYLLCRAWHEEPIATLPNDDVKLARMARLSPDEWERLKPEIMPRFSINGNGRLHNVKLKKTVAFCKARSAAGSSGWTAERRKKQASAAKQLAKHRTEQRT